MKKQSYKGLAAIVFASAILTGWRRRICCSTRPS